MAASLSLREAGLESNPPPQGSGPIPLYYWECFYHSLSLCKETEPRVPSVSSLGQRDDLFPDLLGRISGPQSLISFCSHVSAAWNDNETHLNPFFFFKRSLYE